MIDAIIPWLPVIGVVVGGFIGGAFTLFNRRGGERVARLRQLPPTWPEMWDRLDELDKRVQDSEEKYRLSEQRSSARERTMARVLNTIASQWPTGVPYPDLDPKDVEVLGDTIPKPWRASARKPSIL